MRGLKAGIKAAIGAVVFRLGIHHLLHRNRALVVLFHRVDDRCAGNSISCSTRQFDAFCAFFRRYFVVVGLHELLDKLERNEDVSRHLVITFDDGYRDNYTEASRLLLRHGLPASFFLATNLIGSRRVPWWDAQDGIASEWMSWDDVRALRKQGFGIGAHTVNHADLGQVRGAEAVTEVVESGRRLAAELGTEVRLFSYPYGREHQITEENREAVRRAGYRCCLSVFGGAVGPGSDPYRLNRVPISPWSPHPTSSASRHSSFTRKRLKRSAHRSRLSIRDYLDSNNNDPKPFVWTKTADKMVEKLGSFCKSLLTQQTRNTLNKSVPGTLDLRGGSSRAERDDRGGGRWSR